MDRRSFLGSVAAAAYASSVGVRRGAAQTLGSDDEKASPGWPLLPYDVKRRRANPDGARLPDGLVDVEQAWEFDAEGASTPVVSGGTVYVGTFDGVSAVDAATGEETWSYEAQGEVRQPPAFHEGTVYAGTSEGEFFAVNARTGEEEWSVGLDGEVTTEPMVDGVDIFVGTGRENHLYSLDVSDGTENWSTETRVPVVTAPAVLEERVVYVDGALVFALDRFTGEPEWRSYSGGTLSDAVIGETRVYTVGGGTVYAQRLRNGVDRWSKTVRGEIVGGPVLHNNSLYIATDSGETGFLYSLDLNSDGWTEWQVETTGGFVGSPVLVDGVLYGATLEGSEGRLYAFNPSDGEVTGEYIIGNELIEQDGDDKIEGIDVDLTGGPTVAGANAYLVGEEGMRAFGDVEQTPPTASFEISPNPPPVGEITSFDASGSTAGTAPIDRYRWRFRSDAEEFSAGGASYEQVFEDERSWTVSLTVTDEDGLSDTVTREMNVGGVSEGGNESVGGRVETGNTTVPTTDVSTPGIVDAIGEGVLLTLGALGAIISALGFSAYWRMDPEREKLHRREKKGGLCPDCGASVKIDDVDCRVCGTELPTNGDEE